VSSFTFSKVFSEISTQEEVFEFTCKSLVDDLITKGKGGLIFTYGMTCAGKTFTVIGSPNSPGVLPQSLNYLYSCLENQKAELSEFKVLCNYVEIYNEEVFDLLANDPKNKNFKKKLNVKMKDTKFFLQDVVYNPLNSIEDFNSALAKGIAKKAHATTSLNQNSSRSHTIFKIILKSKENDDEEYSLSIVDLAGSERANRTETQGKELVEACKINNSLSVLGKCMEAMRYNSIFTTKKIVPFRESKLTMLFQEYFQGDQNIIMITNINPRKEDFEETLRALNYSCIAKEIKPARSTIINNRTLGKKSNNTATKENEGKIEEEGNTSTSLFNPNLFNTARKNESYLNNNTNNISYREWREDVDKLKEELEFLKNQMAKNMGSNPFITKNYSYNNSTENSFMPMIPLPVFINK
jgi:hypothetical protein